MSPSRSRMETVKNSEKVKNWKESVWKSSNVEGRTGRA